MIYDDFGGGQLQVNKMLSENNNRRRRIFFLNYPGLLPRQLSI